MSFLQLTLDLGSTDPAPFEEALFGAGALAVTLVDAGDDPVFEPAPGTTPMWPSVRLQALFEESADPLLIETSLTRSVGPLSVPKLAFSPLADRVWEREWLRYFRPMRFGRRLWICPQGRRPQQSDAVVIDLDPGLAFGTGTHATTALCLDWLDSADLGGARVVDYGCGSGILAIAAVKLGADAAFAIDIDPQALAATRRNALHNGVAEHVRAAMAGTPVPWAANVLLANILADPLLTLAPTLAALVAPAGHLILSGILAEQSDEVASAYRKWFDMSPAVVRDGWARLVGGRHHRS